MAAPSKGPIQLITNNFKIQSRNKGIIYTYKVDFIEGQAASMAEPSGTKNAAGSIGEDQGSKVA